MAGNSFGTLFRFTTWGESHGPAIGVVVDGGRPRLPLGETDIQHWLDKRKPGQSRYTTQRREADLVRIMSGTFDGVTTGTPIQLLIENTDQRSKDYRNIADRFRPGHADYTYWKKYGIRDYRGGGRASARETASRVAAGAVARKILGPGVTIRGALVQIGPHAIDRSAWDWSAIEENPFWCPDAAAALRWADYLDGVRNAGGILGGISTGQDIVARFAVKPTSSILQPMRTVDVDGNEVEIETHGRHDPCVGIRAVPVGEAMVACVLADHLLRYRAIGGGV